MSVRLCVGDAVLVNINNDDDDDNKNLSDDSRDNIQIGTIKYIGYIHGFSMSEYVGIELVESHINGHNGIVNGYQYFDCPKGYGLHTKITNIVRKLAASEITTKMQQIITILKTRLNQYVQALSERDQYIERLKSKQKYLNQLLKESKALQQYLNLPRTSNTKNKLNTESPSFSSVNTMKSPSPGIILFSPQKRSNMFPQSNTKLQTKNTASNTSQFHSFGVDPITPITLTPRSESPSISPPTVNTSTVLHSMNKKNGVSRNWNVNNTFPDIEPIKSYDSRTKNVFFIDSEYASSTKTEWNDDELRDVHDNVSSVDNNNIYSSYSSIVTSNASKQNSNSSPPNSQQSMNVYTNTNNMYHELLKLNKSHSNSSQNIPFNHNKAGIMPYHQPQQQYAYSHMTHEQLQKQHRLPIPLNVQQQIVTNRCVPFYHSYSSPLNLHNIHSHNKMPQLYNNSKSDHYQIQYVMVNNNHNNNNMYYKQPHIDHWMQQQQQGKQLHAQQ